METRMAGFFGKATAVVTLAMLLAAGLAGVFGQRQAAASGPLPGVVNGALPDLVVQEIIWNGTAGGRMVYVNVANQGSVGAGGFSVTLRLSDGRVASGGVSSLAAGARATVGVWFWTPAPACGTYSATADSANKVPELDEGNNTLSTLILRFCPS